MGINKMDCSNWTFHYFERKLDEIIELIRELKKGEIKIMAQIDDLNAAIAAEDVEITDIMTSIAAVSADITKLLAAIAAGGTPTDLTQQLTAIQSHLATLTTGAQQLKDADTAANAPKP
jgi:capsule polysaccharide export protein KpsE/RkpR